ncbi:NAD(P)/FAD-dependent oxidoreductase [Herbiconiux daphne]|uniref:FAD-binding oxidoreductase n=1 Tax=Herbiconiux daphne TaxID=2970914 RepID=A0ABT2H117_9MICO|nr:FAD-dependent oxidoreductase [Herbiconiux daphne]MCS5733614.1 FAD-binding oxidoreductase [Herbiconiux daphne]
MVDGPADGRFGDGRSGARADGRSAHRDVSFWFDSLAESGQDALAPRAPLSGDSSTGVCIVGGGLTGLWTAYYLKKADPSLQVTIVEKHVVGFGASGRNGGWCSALFPRSTDSLRREYGDDAARAMREAMIDTVDEVGRVIDAEGIDCDFVKGGTIVFARDTVQRSAAMTEVDEARRFGVDRLELVTSGSHDDPRSRALAATSSLAAAFDPACARLHPGKLVRQLASVLEAMGVVIAEQTEIVEWAPHRALFSGAGGDGLVSCDQLVLATEAYGSQLPGVGRRIMPLYSLMIATEPLPDDLWEELGIEHGMTFSDYRHLLIYGQRTADNRFAFGGRGARYHWGSSIKPGHDRVARVFDHLQSALGDLFPAARNARFTHRWGGPLGVARDWHPTASFNPRTGVAFAGGYVGDGLSTTNLAGRTLAVLIGDARGVATDVSGPTSDAPTALRPTSLHPTSLHPTSPGPTSAATLRTLPWVNHLSPKWEPEPLRFLGANLGLVGTGAADLEESVTGRRSIAARLLGPLTGH